MRMLSVSSSPDEQALDVYSLVESIADEDDVEAQGILADFLDEFPRFMSLLWLDESMDAAASGVSWEYMTSVRGWLAARLLVWFSPQGVWFPEDLADLDRVGVPA